MNNEARMDPDWVILGVPSPDGNGVTVVASRELRGVSIETLLSDFRRMRDGSGYEIRSVRSVVEGYRLEAEMADLIMVSGATYEEALGRLDDQWDPDEPAPAREAIMGEMGELT